MKEISLTQGKVALVDDEDYDFLMQWKWYARGHGKLFYAVRQTPSIDKFGKYKQKRIKMHHLLFHCPNDKVTDHKDGNGLNNQKDNLREATKQQNACNKSKSQNCSSIYKGVHWSKQANKWIAEIYFNYIKFPLGSFDNEIEAAIAYNNKAIELFGEFAKLNIII
jgi:hypothetical protein